MQTPESGILGADAVVPVVIFELVASCLMTSKPKMSELEQKYYKQKNLIQFLERDNKEMKSRLQILSR